MGADRAYLARRVSAEMVADPARVVAQLFLPGEQLPPTRSRTAQIVDRVMALEEERVHNLAAQLLADFSSRHADFAQLLDRHAAIVAHHVADPSLLTTARRVVLGASFTSEYAVEGAALCNPSAVLHPDQSGLAAGQARIAISLRGIGEGHISSIGFCTAVVGPGEQWEFLPRPLPACAGVAIAGRWRRRHLRAVLSDLGRLDGVSQAVLSVLPTNFGAGELESALANLPHGLMLLAGSAATVDLLRRLVASAYSVDFAAAAHEVDLGQRVLVPSTPEESNGMEDARFTRFILDDCTVEYRATYTAYDGHQIAPRMLTSTDLCTFRAHRLSGPAARNKGMALFPRTVHGRHLALCRSDGETTSVSKSDDGFSWSHPVVIQSPAAAWELVQVGNCGPPIETERGWLVITHGVGPMRSYSIGAILLDLDEPTRVIARLDDPLMTPVNGERDGYVPNVLYSCGGLVHDGRLWLPLGIDDARIGVAHCSLKDLLDAMVAV